MSIEDLVMDLYRKGIFMLGTFKLSSGRISPYYIDLRKALAHPEIYTALITKLLDKVNSYGLDYTAVVGVATGGIPYATLLAALTLKPLGYVRIEKKEHGTMSKAEGAISHHRVLIVDDVTTTGMNLARAAETVISNGGEVVGFAVIVDREEGAENYLKNKFNKPLIALLKLSDMLKVLREHNLISDEDYKKIMNYKSRVS